MADTLLYSFHIQVDYTGYTTINPQRFGQKFVGKVRWLGRLVHFLTLFSLRYSSMLLSLRNWAMFQVANPHDILIFTKAVKKRQPGIGNLVIFLYCKHKILLGNLFTNLIVKYEWRFNSQ